jgi:hypothetical protein
MSDFPTTVRLLEDVLRKLGLDPTGAKVREEPGTVAWGVMRGSAQVLLMATSSDRGVWVRAIAPVVKVPTSSEAKLTVYSRLLDLNAKTMRNAAFGVLNDNVVIVSERPAEGLDAAELEQILKHVGATADHYDDAFEKEYGLPKASQA